MSAKEDAIPNTGVIHGRIAERLFESRTVLVHGEITSKRAQEVTAQLLALSAESEAPITLFLHSEGGHVEAGDSIHDIIRANLHRAPMYSGQIESTGPRYCPSIEDKVVRFAEKPA